MTGLTPKIMIASGDTDEEALEILGDKVLGHHWNATEDKLVFKVTVNLSAARLKKKAGADSCDLTEADIPRLIHMRLTKRCLL